MSSFIIIKLYFKTRFSINLFYHNKMKEDENITELINNMSELKINDHQDLKQTKDEQIIDQEIENKTPTELFVTNQQTKDESSDVINIPDKNDILVQPILYDLVLNLLESQFKVFVLIVGKPASGKTIVGKQIINDAIEKKINYLHTFDPVKPTYNEELIVVESIQIKPFSKMMEESKKFSYICILLQTKDKTLSDQNKQMNQCPPPMYYGIFVSAQEYVKVINKPYTQKTPLHVTCLFVGGNKKLLIPKQVTDSINHPINVKIRGISMSLGGEGLVVCPVDGNSFPGIEGQPSTPHITLSTFQGYKPVDVGKQITSENTSHIMGLSGKSSKDHELILRGIFAPTW